MPKYRVQLKQGSRTITEHIEAKSLQSVLDFFSLLSTAKVTEVLKIEYENNTNPPIDDMLYFPFAKVIIGNLSAKTSKQVMFHNIKPSKNTADIIQACKTHLDINGLSVDNCYTALIKTSI